MNSQLPLSVFYLNKINILFLGEILIDNKQTKILFNCLGVHRFRRRKPPGYFRRPLISTLT